jgi:RHS repeat-associated protein
VKTRYTYGTSIVSQTRNVASTPATSYYGYDGHGNITFLTDAGGAITDSYDYDAWGMLVASTGATPNTRLYTGEEFDPDLGLLNLRARTYQAAIGRFLTTDRAPGRPSAPASFNRYLFANGDPVDLHDPSGLAPQPNPAPRAGGGGLSEYAALALITATLAQSTKVRLSKGNNQGVEVEVAAAATPAYQEGCTFFFIATALDGNTTPIYPWDKCVSLQGAQKGGGSGGPGGGGGPGGPNPGPPRLDPSSPGPDGCGATARCVPPSGGGGGGEGKCEQAGREAFETVWRLHQDKGLAYEAYWLAWAACIEALPPDDQGPFRTPPRKADVPDDPANTPPPFLSR